MKRVEPFPGAIRLEGLRLIRCEPNNQHGWWTMVLTDEEDGSEHRIRLTGETGILDRNRNRTDPVSDGDLLNIAVREGQEDVAFGVQIVQRAAKSPNEWHEAYAPYARIEE